MMQIDERILEDIDEEDGGTPATMKSELRCTVSEERLKSRYKSLCERELVAPIQGACMKLRDGGKCISEGI